MTQVEFSAFEGSPMKRAKLRGRRRNAAIVLGSVGTSDDVDVLARALDDEDPLPPTGAGQAVREHAAWALAQIAARGVAGDA